MWIKRFEARSKGVFEMYTKTSYTHGYYVEFMSRGSVIEDLDQHPVFPNIPGIVMEH